MLFVVVLAVLGVALGLPTNSTKTDISPRISDGHETDIEHNPWQLALLYDSRHFCGAVEIHPRWALTTGHCLESVLVDRLTVRAGSTTKSFGGQVVDVRSIFVHPDFNIQTNDYDFALLELNEPIAVQTAAPIALPEPQSEVLDGEDAIITGWGVLTPNGVSPEILHRVEGKVMAAIKCMVYDPFQKVTNRMFCVANDDRANNACQGDGGGPVLVEGRLAGLVSHWGGNCGERFFPGVHAKVASVLDWIYETSGI